MQCSLLSCVKEEPNLKVGWERQKLWPPGFVCSQPDCLSRCCWFILWFIEKFVGLWFWGSGHFSFFVSLPCFILLPFFISFRPYSDFSFPTLQVKVLVLPWWSIDDHSSFSCRHPSLATWYGCQFIDGCVRQSHDSCFYSEGLPYKPTAILGYWANKLWSSRKSISYIDKQTHAWMHASAHNEMQMEEDVFLDTEIQTCTKQTAAT